MDIAATTAVDHTHMRWTPVDLECETERSPASAPRLPIISAGGSESPGGACVDSPARPSMMLTENSKGDGASTGIRFLIKSAGIHPSGHGLLLLRPSREL